MTWTQIPSEWFSLKSSQWYGSNLTIPKGAVGTFSDLFISCSCCSHHIVSNPQKNKVKTKLWQSSIKRITKILYLYAYLVPLLWNWSTFGIIYILQSSWVWCHNLCTAGIGDILSFFSAEPLKVCQIGSLPSVFRPAKRCFGSGQCSDRAPKDTIKCISALCFTQLMLNPDKSPCPSHWKTPQSRVLPPPCFTVRKSLTSFLILFLRH